MCTLRGTRSRFHGVQSNQSKAGSSFGDLASAIEFYFDAERDIARGTLLKDDEEQHKWLEGLHKIIYASKGDDFSKQVDEAVSRLSYTLKEFTLAPGSKLRKVSPVTKHL